MYLSVSMELQFLLLSVAAGLASAFLYDILRISRRIVRVSDTVINIEDILFFAVAAFLIFIASYLKNSGEIRWQSFIGFAVGVFLYASIVKNRLLNISTVVISFMVRLAGTVIRIILFPLRLILKIFQKPVSVVAWYTGKGIRRVRNAAKIRSSKTRLTMRNLCSMLGRSAKK